VSLVPPFLPPFLGLDSGYSRLDLMIEVSPDFCRTVPVLTVFNIQAKDKEQAVLHLYRIYNLHPVNQGLCTGYFYSSIL
jgi:hypothetical protein